MSPDDSPNIEQRPPAPAEEHLDLVSPQQAASHGTADSPSAAAAAAAQRTAAGTAATEQLHVCFHCGGHMVYPLDWCEEGPRHWRIMLRCPECEARREGVFEQSVVERLDDEIDRAASALLGDLRRVTHANMSEEAEFFIRALAADLIVPSDF